MPSTPILLTSLPGRIRGKLPRRTLEPKLSIFRRLRSSCLQAALNRSNSLPVISSVTPTLTTGFLEIGIMMPSSSPTLGSWTPKPRSPNVPCRLHSLIPNHRSASTAFTLTMFGTWSYSSVQRVPTVKWSTWKLELVFLKLSTSATSWMKTTRGLLSRKTWT